MLITFTGRKSGRVFTTPVRYLKDNDKILCFTSSGNQWWRNLRNGADVTLLVGGHKLRCHAEAISGDPARISQALGRFLSIYPQDAAYYDVKLDEKGNAILADIEKAATNTIMVEAVSCP